MKVAYYSPLPPSRSGIADYSELLLPELRKRTEVVVAKRGGWRRDPGGDVALYHVGNDPDEHAWIVEALQRRAGVVVLHEHVLHHLVVGMTFVKDPPAYLAAMEREAGLVGRLLGYAVIDGRIPPLWETRPEQFPLTGEILDRASGLIVHSRFVEEHARKTGFAGPIWRIPHPAWPAPAVDAAAARAELGPEPLLGCFGHLNDTKRIPQLLEAFAELRRRLPSARLLLVGDATERIDRLPLPDGVIRERYVPEERLWSLMAACDVLINLRAPTMGETSGTALRALSLGKPLIVTEIGWYGELPEGVAIKVAPGEGETAALVSAMAMLVEDAALRSRMGEAARALAEGEHRVDRVAAAYVAALEQAAGGPAVRQAVLSEVARAAGDVGIRPTDDEVGELAARLREVGLDE